MRIPFSSLSPFIFLPPDFFPFLFHYNRYTKIYHIVDITKQIYKYICYSILIIIIPFFDDYLLFIYPFSILSFFFPPRETKLLHLLSLSLNLSESIESSSVRRPSVIIRDATVGAKSSIHLSSGLDRFE